MADGSRRREPPWDSDAEESLIGAMLLNGEARRLALREVDASDFWKPVHAVVFTAVEQLYAEGLPVDEVTVHARIETMPRPRPDVAVDALRALAAGTPGSMHVSGYSDVVRRLARCRAGIKYGDEIAEAGWGGDVDVVDKLVDVARVRVGDRPTAVETDDLADLWELELAEQENPTKPWVIPGCLRAGEAYILTGSEGGGKMMWLRQVGTCIASGVHPATGLSEAMERRRVLALDLQEDRVDQAAEVSKLRRALVGLYEPGWYRSVSWSGGVDLLSPRGRRRVEGAIEEARPDLVVIGPLVKSFRAPEGRIRYGEDVVDEVTAILDELMDRYSFGLMIEAHSGNTRGSDEDWRVRGSSVWRSWPAFSHGLKVVNMEPREAEVVRARPDRYSGRAWPTRLFANPSRSYPWSVSDGDYANVCRAMGLDWLVAEPTQSTLDVDGTDPF